MCFHLPNSHYVSLRKLFQHRGIDDYVADSGRVGEVARWPLGIVQSFY
jgi:hypothetical protein